MIDRFKGKLKREVEKGGVSYAAGTNVVVIGQTDGATTLNTGGFAFCCVMPNGCIEHIQDTSIIVDMESFSKQSPENITKRELFAGLAMQGLLAQTPCRVLIGEIVKEAVQCADALLEELSKTDKTE